MMFEKHSFKVDGYSAIAPEDIAMFFFKIMQSKTMKLIKSTELQKQRKELQKNCYKSKEKQVGMANIT